MAKNKTQDTQVSKPLLAVRMMSGVTLWFAADKVEMLKTILSSPRAQWPAFVEVEREMINPVSVEGIYTPDAMEREMRIKQGEWLCRAGEWHSRGEKCERRVKVGVTKAFVGTGKDRRPIEIPVYEGSKK